MTNWHELTGFQRDLLKTLAGLERHSESVSGQDLCRQLEADGLTNVNHGRLYQNLDMLVEDGWVSKGKKDQRTNAYATTTAARESARRELQSWMAIFEREEIVTDGGAERALLWECDSVHPVDAECKPWGGRDD
jgi:DNA-binding PadR family transcriptional regulator